MTDELWTPELCCGDSSVIPLNRSRYKKYKSLFKKALGQTDQETLKTKLWELEESLDVTNILVARQQARLEVSHAFSHLKKNFF
jgi:hypothetical protein